MLEPVFFLFSKRDSIPRELHVDNLVETTY